MTLPIEPRILASWKDGAWRIDSGNYRVALGKSADDLSSPVEFKLAARR
ncbi:MAG: hypothetical protein ACREXT_15855 [Gammaproteobacteria bacterium]